MDERRCSGPDALDSAPTRSAAAVAWRAKWLHQDAWTVREFALLCCGWNPSENEVPDIDRYNEALEAINRAVRVKILPTLELQWPPTHAERLYDSVPYFKPGEVARWAADRYPDAFPYSSEGWLLNPTTEPVVWEDISIEFISEHKVQIKVKEHTYPQNYAELGCHDRRSNKPNKAWEALRALALQEGTVLGVPGPAWTNFGRRMQELRQVLRHHLEQQGFALPDSDPLPFLDGVGYRAVFRVRLSQSFQR